ncbi:MAG: hypothetical protein KJZ86_04880 [Caldilineaceae bacterium]|nr:hypothetical protein [Caldilineaceae bacterium]HRJ42455.1 hypothetical protein [Caldilineaceae bacterium]
MSVQTITVDLPEELYRQLKQAADSAQRSVSDIVQERLRQDEPILPALPQDVERELAAFAFLSDEALWQLARATLSTAEQAELAELNYTAQDSGLSPGQQARREHLLNLYQRTMVRRSEATGHLQDRGRDISSLFALSH